MDIYDNILKEYFNINDKETRKVMISINESDKNMVLMSLASKLYDNIVKKVDDIDYGSIPKSEGDIKKIENYDQLIECIDTINKILKEYKQDPIPIKIITEAINHIESRKELFEKGFKYNVELPIVIYCTIVLSIISSISLLISTSIDFIKQPNNDDFQLTLDKISIIKTKDNLLFKNLEKFNKACRNKSIDKCLDYVIKKNIKNLSGLYIGTLAGSAIAFTIILNIIPILRELIFFFYYSRTKISDYFQIQSELIQMNVFNLENNKAIPKKDKKDIIKKQTKISNFMKKISKKIEIDQKKSEKEIDKNITVDNKKYKINDLVDSIPDSANSAIF